MFYVTVKILSPAQVNSNLEIRNMTLCMIFFFLHFITLHLSNTIKTPAACSKGVELSNEGVLYQSRFSLLSRWPAQRLLEESECPEKTNDF